MCANSPVRANARRCKASHTCDARDVNPVQAHSAGTQVVEAIGDTKGLGRTARENRNQTGEICIRSEGVLFGNSLICLKASENLVGVLAMNHPN